MTSTLTEAEKAQLRPMINHPVFTKAVSEALGQVWRSQLGAQGQEACALAFAHYKGSCEVLSAIHLLADEAKVQQPRPLRLNHKA
jgi:hypothetical protein